MAQIQEKKTQNQASTTQKQLLQEYNKINDEQKTAMLYNVAKSTPFTNDEYNFLKAVSLDTNSNRSQVAFNAICVATVNNLGLAKIEETLKLGQNLLALGEKEKPKDFLNLVNSLRIFATLLEQKGIKLNTSGADTVTKLTTCFAEKEKYTTNELSAIVDTIKLFGTNKDNHQNTIKALDELKKSYKEDDNTKRLLEIIEDTTKTLEIRRKEEEKKNQPKLPPRRGGRSVIV